MANIVRAIAQSSAPVIGDGHGSSRVERRTLRYIETQSNIAQAADVAEGKQVANRAKVVNAVAAHISESHVELVHHQQDIAAGDAGIELELAAIRAVALRKNMSMLNGMYGVL